jgi:L-alanine-DL-glutamate epimerase-like enolase superfamily enzyme
MPDAVRIRWGTHTHHLHAPFRIAHGAASTRESLFVAVDVWGQTGWGEGARVPYYPYSLDELTRYAALLDPMRLATEDEVFLEDALAGLPPGPPPARCALDLALHDAWGQALGAPLWKLWGLNPARLPVSSFTLSIPEDDESLERAATAAAHLPFLKLKLGSGSVERDVEIVRRTRALTTGAVLGVDANSAYDEADAARLVTALAEIGVAYVEQPLLADGPERWHRLRDLLPGGMPLLIADESVQTAADVLTLHGGADGVNLKLCKTGGLAGARRAIAVARSLGMTVMIGCMVESNVAVTAAAHLAPLADFCDLDAPQLIRDRVCEGGLTWQDGRMTLPTQAGIGTRGVRVSVA